MHNWLRIAQCFNAAVSVRPELLFLLANTGFAASAKQNKRIYKRSDPGFF